MTIDQHAGEWPTHRLDDAAVVGRMGYGAMQLAGPNVWGPPADAEGVRAVLRAAIDQGVRLVDTANAFGPRTVNYLNGVEWLPTAPVDLVK